jgi:hypothetical protein
MGEASSDSVRRVVHRKRWLLRGLIAGLLLCPLVVGLPYRDSLDRAEARAQKARRALSEEAGVAWSWTRSKFADVVRHLQEAQPDHAQSQKGVDGKGL